MAIKRKQLEPPGDDAKRFVRDMRAFHIGRNAIKRDKTPMNPRSKSKIAGQGGPYGGGGRDTQ
jgi:hypothetical protein